MRRVRQISGLYAITPASADDIKLQDDVTATISGGAQIVQYRSDNTAIAARQAQALADICRRHGVLFIVNDNAPLAEAVGADGVHLGVGDMPIGEARALLGRQMIIGATCHNSLTTAQAAEAAGADYVSFGALFASPTKPAASRCPPATLTAAKTALCLPIVAIGGITADNIRIATAAGADAVAVCHALFSAKNVAETAKKLSAAFLDKDTTVGQSSR